MPKVVVCLLSALAVSVFFGASIGAIYVFVLPRIFPGPGWGTDSPLVWGIAIATLIGGCIGYRIATTERLLIKISLALCSAVVTAILVSYLSLFIILNTRGS